MQAVITGGAGVLGSPLAPGLLAAGALALAGSQREPVRQVMLPADVCPSMPVPTIQNAISPVP